MTTTPRILSADAIATLTANFRKIALMTVDMRQIHRALDVARAEARESLFERKQWIDYKPALRPKMPPLPLVVAFGPSGTGKDTIIAEYLKKVSENERWPFDKQLVVSFELSVDATKKAMHGDFLEGTEDLDPDRGTDPALSRRVRMQAANLDTELSICNETQHVVGSDSQARNKSVADAFKKLLNHNTSALALFGTESGDRIFDANNEFVQRSFQRYNLTGARINVPEEVREFKDLLQLFAQKLPEHGVVESAKILTDPAIIGTIFTQCKGRYGTVGRLLKNATRLALMEGAYALLPHHLWLAVASSKMLFDDDPVNYFSEYSERK
jgi:hypothetical protein